MNALRLLRRHVSNSWATLSLFQFLVLIRSLLGGTGFMLVVPALQTMHLPMDTRDPELQFLLSLLPVSTISGILVLFLGLLISMNAISYYNSILEEQIEQDLIASVRKEIFRLTLGAEWQHVSGIHRADYTRIQTEEVDAVSGLLRYSMEITTVLATLLVYTLLCLYLSTSVTLLAIGFAAFLLLVTYPLHQKIIESGTKHLAASEELYRRTSEQLHGIRVIKSNQSEEQQNDVFVSTVDNLGREEKRYTQLSALTRLLNGTIAAMFFCLLAWVSINVLQTDAATLVVIAIIFSRTLPLVANLQTLSQRLAFMIPSLEEVTNYIWSLETHQEAEQSIDQRIELNRPITFDEVSYRYPGSDERVLKDLSLTLDPKSLILVSGPSGIGKTTLADMIAGLILPQEGKILSGEETLNPSNQRAWRGNITYVPQVPFLIDASVRENLCLLLDYPVSDEKLETALKSASASFVFRLAGGLDTRIGEDGSRLSAGERQRLLLARALLQDRPVLILDESLSNLDPETEQAFMQTLAALKTSRTIILISHKTYLAETADQVIVID
ncbi:MAG: ABC transporter ATP-binding protein [Pseudomonadales bacterium]|nr:ABC transporter ATP-binding protein [Pseudomonadales bacterium]